MHTITKSVEVNVPVRTAYDQWTQFEEFPQFMEGVESVKQLDDKRLHWHAKIWGKVEDWDAEITSQHPDREIAWRSTSGARNDGTVSFESLGTDKTKVSLRLDVEPQDPVEKIGDALGILSRRVEADLKRFKDFIEKRGTETGAWRGEIEGEQVKKAG